MELPSDNSSASPTLLKNSNYSNSGEFTREQYIVLSVCGNLMTLVSSIGVIGNALNIVVLVKLLRKSNQTPIYHLLLAMGVADLISLFLSTVYTLTMFTSWPPLLFQVYFTSLPLI